MKWGSEYKSVPVFKGKSIHIRMIKFLEAIEIQDYLVLQCMAFLHIFGTTFAALNICKVGVCSLTTSWFE